MGVRLDSMEPALSQLAEKFNPKSTCVFCNVEAQKDGHSSGRCPNYSDTVARAVQASKLGLCGRCLKAVTSQSPAVPKQRTRKPSGKETEILSTSPNERYRSDAKPILLFELAAGSIVDSDDGSLSTPRPLVGRSWSTSMRALSS
ncbi:unnamed protein product [Heligmosomoides polygyrus]|uniref:CCHC-type domain-containing protein n=1 Tax=Heligmosomoides polygyrus TaxID=6339 RepID=A0A183F9H1_HELPZ|nr:unnamed protein product [Heligmosomoides polygyrus]